MDVLAIQAMLFMTSWCPFFFYFFFLHLAEVKKEISLFKCQQASSSTSQTSSSSSYLR